MAKPEYIILDENDAQDLARAVNSYMRLGYVPLGGLVVDSSPAFLSGKFKQSLVLDHDKIPEVMKNERT